MKLAPDIKNACAEFSDCLQYRYSLVRQWDTEKLMCNFLMLNPSTASADKDDPTVAKVQRLSRRWGFGGVIVTNLFAFRATDPKVMRAAEKPVGPDNNGAIIDSALMAGKVICAWGAHGTHRGRDRRVMELLEEHEITPYSLVRTKAGQPGHPLYVREDVEPVPFELV